MFTTPCNDCNNPVETDQYVNMVWCDECYAKFGFPIDDEEWTAEELDDNVADWD